MMVGCERKKCIHCGKVAIHNPCRNPERRDNGRCTYCGWPCNPGNATSGKRAYAEAVCKSQTIKAFA